MALFFVTGCHLFADFWQQRRKSRWRRDTFVATSRGAGDSQSDLRLIGAARRGSGRVQQYDVDSRWFLLDTLENPLHVAFEDVGVARAGARHDDDREVVRLVLLDTLRR